MSKHDSLKPPYSPDSLAARWGVTANAIRYKCNSGELRHFRFGKLYRIPQIVVEEFESCQTSASDASAAASASIGATHKAAAFGINLRHARGLLQKPKQ